MKLKKTKSFRHSLVEQWKIYKTLKENNLISYGFLRFHWLVKYKGVYDVVRIIVEGKLLATILLKKYEETRCVEIVGLLGDNEDIETLEVLQTLKVQMNSYGIMGYDRMLIKISKYQKDIINLFKEELGFYEDIRRNLEYFFKTRRNESIILHKSLIQ